MKYKITVQAIQPRKEDDRYDNWQTVYEQQFENLDLPSLAVFLNEPSAFGRPQPKPSEGK